MATKFRDQFSHRPVARSEPGGGPRDIETAGYRTITQRVMDFNAAGQRLMDQRMQYDPEDCDWEDVPITRDPGLDIGEAFAEHSRVMQRINDRRKAVMEKRRKATQDQTDQELPAPVGEPAERPAETPPAK